jgi:hypothetical protein
MSKPYIEDEDTRAIAQWIANPPETESVAQFKAGPGIERLTLRFDAIKLVDALKECLVRENFQNLILHSPGRISSRFTSPYRNGFRSDA